MIGDDGGPRERDAKSDAADADSEFVAVLFAFVFLDVYLHRHNTATLPRFFLPRKSGRSPLKTTSDIETRDK